MLKHSSHKNLLAAVLVLASTAGSAIGGSAYPDKLVDFKDVGVVAATNTPTPVHWLDSFAFLVNATGVDGDNKSGRVDLVAVNVKTGRTYVVSEGATLLCWFANEKSGVAKLAGSPPGFRHVVLDGQGTVRVTEKSAAAEDCQSKQYFMKRGTAVTDLGKGAGAIVVERTAELDVSQTYVQEDGRRISLGFPGAHFGGSGMYRPWLDEYSVGRAGGGALRMRSDGTVRLDEGDASLERFFKSPSSLETKTGHVVRTGVRDPYNGDTFFVPAGKTPVRIYKSKGAWDQLGPASTAPDGCGVLMSMSADGVANRVSAYMNNAPQTLHYVDICSALSR